MQKQGEYRFFIPSYKRADKQKTIDYLLSIGCDKKRIIVSTQTLEDYEVYSDKYGKQVGEIIYAEGDRVSINRNTCLDYAKQGEPIVLLEDDLNKVVKLIIKNHKKALKKVETIEELDKLIERGFKLAFSEGTICFGLNMTTNPFFMNKGYTKKGWYTQDLWGL